MVLKSLLGYVVHTLALIITIFGAALAVLGHLTIFHVHNVKGVHFFQTFAIGLIVIGGVIAFMGFTGLLGTYFQSRCLLMTFSVLMILLLLVEFSVVVVAFFFYNEDTLREALKSSLQYYNEEKDIKKIWDMININLECCGVDSADDWGDSVPNSCCKDLDINDVCHKELANQTPCLPVVIKIFKEKIPLSFTVISGVQLFCIFASFSLSRL